MDTGEFEDMVDKVKTGMLLRHEVSVVVGMSNVNKLPGAGKPYTVKVRDESKNLAHEFRLSEEEMAALNGRLLET